MEDNSRRNRVARRENTVVRHCPSYPELVEENKRLEMKVKELERQLTFSKYTVESTRGNLEEAMANCVRLERENSLLKEEVNSTKPGDPIGFDAAMARLEAKINKKREPKTSLADKTKLEELQLQLKEEQKKIEKLQNCNKSLSDQLENYHAIVVCYEKKFESTVRAAEKEMNFLKGLANTVLEDDRDDSCVRVEDQRSEAGTECSVSSSSTMMTSVSRIMNKSLPPPAVVMDAITMISREELDELTRMDMSGGLD